MLKRKICNFAITIVAASLLATLAAGTASAATIRAVGPNVPVTTLLCVHGANNFDVCAAGRGSQAISMTQPVNGVTTWVWSYPGYGEIKDANDSTQCMQLDHAGGNIVIEATCDAASFQEWQLNSITSQFQSDWDKSLCLQYDNAAGNVLVAGTCVDTWYEIFYGS